MLVGDDPELGRYRRTEMSALTRDITEILAEIAAGNGHRSGARGARPVITYHSACSLQHGQKIHDLPMQLAATGRV